MVKIAKSDRQYSLVIEVVVFFFLKKKRLGNEGPHGTTKVEGRTIKHDMQEQHIIVMLPGTKSN